MEEQKQTFKWKRLIITAILVVVAAGAVGGTTYYVLNSNFEKERESNEKALNAVTEQVNELEEKKATPTATNTTTTIPTTTTGTYEATRPTVSSSSTLKRFADDWAFSFSEKVDPLTIKVGNINLYSAGGSVGTQGRKDLQNDILDGFGLDYSPSAFTLHIPVTNKTQLECASCTWELEFTDKVKDLDNNSLVPKSFEIQ